MLGLAIDSAGMTASAAIWQSEGRQFELIAQAALSPEAGQADQLINTIERLLREQALDYAAFDLIAVNRGPGSFTGIRSAVALARGLALAARLPVLGVTSHEALAVALDHVDGGRGDDGRPLLIALDARRGEVYAQTFSSDGRPIGEIAVKTPAAVGADLETGAWRLAGSGADLVAGALSGAADVHSIETPPIDAAAVARAAAARLAVGDVPGPGFDLRPLYVRAPDAVPPTPLIPTEDVA